MFLFAGRLTYIELQSAGDAGEAGDDGDDGDDVDKEDCQQIQILKRKKHRTNVSNQSCEILNGHQCDHCSSIGIEMPGREETHILSFGLY